MNEEIRDRLATLPLFEGVSKEGLDDLAMIGQVTRLPTGARLLSQGEAAGKTQCLFVILSGHLRASLEIDPAAGKEQVLARFGPGEEIGEVSFLDRQARVATVTSEDTSAVYVLSRTSFEKFAEKHPRASFLILMRIARSLAERLRRTNDELVESLRASRN